MNIIIRRKSIRVTEILLLMLDRYLRTFIDFGMQLNGSMKRRQFTKFYNARRELRHFFFLVPACEETSY